MLFGSADKPRNEANLPIATHFQVDTYVPVGQTPTMLSTWEPFGGHQSRFLTLPLSAYADVLLPLLYLALRDATQMDRQALTRVDVGFALLMRAISEPTGALMYLCETCPTIIAHALVHVRVCKTCVCAPETSAKMHR